MHRWKRLWNRIRRSFQLAWRLFAEKGLEPLEESTLTWLDRALHFCVFVIREFIRNRCAFRATALAYTTLLALVPLLAITVSLATSLFHEYYTEERIRQYIDRFVAYIAPQLDLLPAEQVQKEQGETDLPSTGVTNQVGKVVPEEVPMVSTNQQIGATNAPVLLSQKKARTGREAVARAISQSIANIQRGTLSVTGVLGLIVVAIMLLATIETAFNEIWGVTEGRSWASRLVLYWTAITLGPIVLLALGLLISNRLQATENVISHVPYLKRFLFGILPYGLATICFSVLYKLIPNTTVQWRAAFLGGLVGGSLWLVNNMIQAHFVSRVVNASAIYGPLASLPIFLVGLYMSWLVLLFGAQTAYLWQNRRVYWQERIARNINQAGRELVAVGVMACVSRRFLEGEAAPTIIELANEVGIPSQVVAQIVAPLQAAGLIVEVTGRQTGFFPARAPDRITLFDVIRAMRYSGGVQIQPRGELVPSHVFEALQQIRSIEEQQAKRFTLAQLIQSYTLSSPQEKSDVKKEKASVG